MIFNHNFLSFASPATRENTQSDDPVSHQIAARVYERAKERTSPWHISCVG